MEQGRNVLAVTNALQQRLSELRAIAASRHRDRHHLRPVLADLGNAHQFLPGDRLRAARRHHRHRRRVEECARGRGAGLHPAAWHAVHRLAAGKLRPDHQSVCPGRTGDRHRRDGRRHDRHRRELHRGARTTRQGVCRRADGNDHSRNGDDDAAAVVLDADHRDVVPANLLSRCARRAALQSAGVQQDVCDGVFEPADPVSAAGDHRLGLQAQYRAR